MPSFFALNIAVSGLRAHQYAMNVTAHNIANAGTPGYHRQEAIFRGGSTIAGTTAVAGQGIPQLGTGVEVQYVKRAQTDHLDNQVRITNQWLGSWGYKKEALEQVEAVLAEPTDLGLAKSLDDFWNAWSDLADTPAPENLPARECVIQRGVALSQRIRNLYRDFRELQHDADTFAIDSVKQINQYAHDIAKLNEEIRRSIGSGGQPNDMIDRRSALMDELSKIVKFEAAGGQGSDLIISIGGKALVQGNIVTELAIGESENGWSQVIWADDGSAANIYGGELAGQIDMRDRLLQNYIDHLNRIASAIVESVNTLHSTGVLPDGSPAGNFFIPGSDASNISIDPSLTAANVATSTKADINNDLAEALSGLQNKILVGDKSINNAYQELVSLIGAHSREAKSRVDMHTLTKQQLNVQRESIAGVSLDEEMSNMVKFQQAYNAAARIFTVIDEMIDTVVNRMGTGGR